MDREMEMMVHEAWSIFETFRNLGIPSEEIFVSPDVVRSAEHPTPTVGVLIRRGGKEFQVAIGPPTPPGFLEAWQEWAETLKTISGEELSAIYSASGVSQGAHMLPDLIVRKGISLDGLKGVVRRYHRTTH